METSGSHFASTFVDSASLGTGATVQRPGMEEANLVVRVKIDPKRRLVEELGAEAGPESDAVFSSLCSLPPLQGATNLMRQILEERPGEGGELQGFP